MVCWSYVLQINTHSFPNIFTDTNFTHCKSPRSGLNEWSLSRWFQARGVWGRGVGGASLMEEVRHWGRALRLPTPAQCSSVGCELTASCSDHHACRLEWTVTRGHREQLRFWFFHSNRK